MLGPYDLNTINVNDVMHFLGDLPNDSVPMFLFSPPYNLGLSSNGDLGRGMGKKGGKWSGGALSDGYVDYGDAMPASVYTEWQKAILSECWRCISDNGVIYYNHKPRIQNGLLQTPLDFNPGLPVRQIVIWARAGGINYNPTQYVPTHEWIVIYAKPDFRLKSKAASGAGDVWYIPQESGTWHPAPFPLALAERALETVQPSLVVDPFSGSGTVAVASTEYAEKARARVAATMFTPMLIDTYKAEQFQLV
jgi:site-specific DNA-methyltransferase (adenine-specific)